MATLEQVLANHQSAINQDQNHPTTIIVTKYATAEKVYRIDVQIIRPAPLETLLFEVNDIASVLNVVLMYNIDIFSGWQPKAEQTFKDPKGSA